VEELFQLNRSSDDELYHHPSLLGDVAMSASSSIAAVERFVSTSVPSSLRRSKEWCMKSELHQRSSVGATHAKYFVKNSEICKYRFSWP